MREIEAAKGEAKKKIIETALTTLKRSIAENNESLQETKAKCELIIKIIEDYEAL